jgi:hypothetical protein
MFVVKSLGREVLPEVGLEVLRQEVPVQRPVQEPNLNRLTLLILYIHTCIYIYIMNIFTYIYIYISLYVGLHKSDDMLSIVKINSA